MTAHCRAAVSFKSQVLFLEHLPLASSLDTFPLEAEIVAGSEGAREALFLRNLLRDLGHKAVSVICTDSLGCVQGSKDPAQHWRLKHMNTRFFFLRDNVQSGSLNIRHVASADNPADLFTKPVGQNVYERLRPRYGIVPQILLPKPSPFRSPNLSVVESPSSDWVLSPPLHLPLKQSLFHNASSLLPPRPV